MEERRRNELFGKYTMWLHYIIRDECSPKSYIFLMHKLNEKEFYWSLSNDSNRAEDGLSLREYYDYLNPDDDIFRVMSRGCTILELLVGLAQRAEIVMYEAELGDRTGEWFWLFLDNLDLLEFSDLNWNDEADRYVDDILSTWLERDFTRTGVGSPFIVNNGNDMRRTSMWDAMQWYLASLVEEE